MIEIGWFVVLILISNGLGKLVFRIFKVQFDSFWESFAFEMGLGLGIIANLVLILGLLDFLYTKVVLGLFAILAILLWRNIKELILKSIAKIKEVIKLISLNINTVIVLTLLLFVIVSLFITYAPTVARDSLDYHLLVPKIFVNQHGVNFVPLRHSNGPFLTEILYTLSLLVSNETLAHMIHWFFGILLIFALYSFSRNYFSKKVSLLACLIFYSIPGVIIQSTWAYNDLTVAFYGFLAVFGFFRWYEKNDKKMLFLSALFLGLGASCKFTTLLLLPLLIFGILLKTILTKEKFLEVLRLSFIYGLIFIGVCSIWYIKSWIMTGNPFHPFFGSLFGDSSLASLGDTRGLTGNYVKDILLSPWNITFHGDEIYVYGGRIGPAFLAFLPLLFFIRKPKPIIKRILIGCLLFFILLFFFQPRVRFLFLVWALLSLIVAFVTFKLIEITKSKLVKLAVILSIMLHIFYNFSDNLPYYARTLPVALGFENKYEYLSKSFESYDLVKYIQDKHIGYNKKLLIWDLKYNQYYYADANFDLLSRTNFGFENSRINPEEYRNLLIGLNPQDFTRRLKGQNYVYVVINLNYKKSEDNKHFFDYGKALLEKCENAGFKLEYSKDNRFLYKVK